MNIDMYQYVQWISICTTIYSDYVGTYRYSLYILVHIDSHCIYWCISIVIVYIGACRYLSYILVHIYIHCIYWYISVFIAYIGTYRYSLYILVHIDIHCIINIKEYKLMDVLYYKFVYIQWMSGQLL